MFKAMAQRMVGANLANARRRNQGFTLIELIVVILIILILVTILVVVILQFLDKGDDEDAKDRIRAIDEAIMQWQDKNGKGSNVFPGSGKNTQGENGRFSGNARLFEELVTNAEKRFGVALMEDVDALSLNDEGKPVLIDGKTTFLDPWGTPFVYWEWASKSKATADDTKPMETATAAKALPSFARNGGGYDIYSAGKDQIFGTEDDICKDGIYADVYDVKQKPNPFAK